MTISQFERKQAQLRAALEAATARLAPHFPNPAAAATAAAYLQSLLSQQELRTVRVRDRLPDKVSDGLVGQATLEFIPGSDQTA